jgi:hypothetical protein
MILGSAGRSRAAGGQTDDLDIETIVWQTPAALHDPTQSVTVS